MRSSGPDRVGLFAVGPSHTFSDLAEAINGAFARWAPMLMNRWPDEEQVPALDVRELRSAIAGNDADRFLAAVRGRELDDVLQQVGAGIPMALEQRREEAEPVAQSVVND